uniref:non-specific serine/threonine protein kinase n=1 Tax=Oryza brachyantha TaxID=4533 RepID=J3N1U9_ORYBR
MESRCFLLQLLALPTIVIFLFLFLVSACHTTDAGALLSFRSHITKDPSGALSSWCAVSNGTTSNGFCRWAGVRCSHGGHVVSLNIRGLGLAGTISPLIGNLTSLRVLDLSDNKLEGEIPASLGKCQELQSLNLSVNFLSGVIPPAIGQLTNLADLCIRHNNISGYVPSAFANLTALTVINVADNYLHGEIPSWLGNLTSLKSFNVAGNLMRGNIPDAVSKLTNLKLLIYQQMDLEVMFLHHCLIYPPFRCCILGQTSFQVPCL